LETSYVDLQLRQALVPVWETALEGSMALERDVRQINARGLAARIDVLRVAALRAGDELGLTTARSQRAAAQGRLATLLGLPATDLPEAADPITSLATPWPDDLETTLRQALDGRPLLEALALQQRASRERAQAARSTLLPALSLVAGAGINTNTIDVPVLQASGQVQGHGNSLALPNLESPGSLRGNFYDWGAMLQLRQPLYDGGRAASGAALAEREAAVLGADAEVARQRIRTTVVETWQQLQISQARINAARAAVVAAERALRDARLRYAAQVEPLTEVLLVQRDLQVAKQNLLMSESDQAQGRALLRRETGASDQLAVAGEH
jgi:outer membrane protein TolC